ncbi:MAG: UDP-N-acetylglucosamine 1-carboxyvinyltransferase [Holosporales bacterium]|jgi:UDP-N-acetylglucosamine 1-carboxyvinyltransferase|nr:UDP-N-acetylglucosamine 1-carboxyvinyltransferase [Holosporales bacterium]
MLQKMRIRGGASLGGTIDISGSKNLSLPAMMASLLTDQPLSLSNVPRLADVISAIELLDYLGVGVRRSSSSSLVLCCSNLKTTEAPYDFVRKMRASVLALGPLLSRFGKASVSLPGGCAIGARGIDLHIKAMQQLGAEVTIENGYINASAPNGLDGCDVNFPISSVTGTENTLMAAVLARGTSRILNAAMEPEVVEFANLLNTMGANITGHGTPIITIEGVESLHGASFEIMPDRIEVGTYAIATVATNGRVMLKGCIPDHLSSFLEILKAAGGVYEPVDGGILVYRGQDKIEPVSICTAQYPGYPTDLQAQYMTLMTIANGASSITENIFENRFMHAPELCRMGANIAINGRTATVIGVRKLSGAQVMATDLRASVSLVIAGLIASGETIVNRLYHLDRGYENLEVKLNNCGADMERLEG